MRYSITLLITFLYFNLCYSQKQSNNWLFGEKAGLSFIDNKILEIDNSQMSSIGATSSWSDASTGDLLFYSNGAEVWNRNHRIMPNGIQLGGTIYSTNTSYVVPAPGNLKKYYLFTINTPEFSTEIPFRQSSIHYSIINMSLAEGYGDVETSQKHILLSDSVTEKIAAIPHANEKDYWIILHGVDNNLFKIYLLSENGILLHQTISVGQIHKYNLTELQGHMKASPDNGMLAVTLRQTDETGKLAVSAPFEIFDFNNKTGVISNPRSLGNYALQYGVSFSPNSEILYLHGFADSGINQGDLLYQFDLTSPEPAKSRIGLLRNNSEAKDYYGLANISLQIGPDGKIYGAGNLSQNASVGVNSLLVINNPNEIGKDSHVTINSLDWTDKRIGIDLPNYIQSLFRGLTPTNNPTIPCDSEMNFKIGPNPNEGIINISVTESCFEPYYCTIYNSLGQLLIRRYIKDQSTIFNIDFLSAGCYFIIIENQAQVVRKIILN